MIHCRTERSEDLVDWKHFLLNSHVVNNVLSVPGTNSLPIASVLLMTLIISPMIVSRFLLRVGLVTTVSGVLRVGFMCRLLSMCMCIDFMFTNIRSLFGVVFINSNSAGTIDTSIIIILMGFLQTMIEWRKVQCAH